MRCLAGYLHKGSHAKSDNPVTLISAARVPTAVYGTYGRLKSQDIRGLYPLPFTLYLGIQQMWFVYGIFTRSVYLTIGAISGCVLCVCGVPLSS